MLISPVGANHWRHDASVASLAGAQHRNMLHMMTAQSKLRGPKKSNLRGPKNEAASSFCPFAPLERFLVAKVSIGERRGYRDGDRVVT